MTESSIEYQKALLAETVEEAVCEGEITVETGMRLHRRIAATGSTPGVDRCWDRICSECDLV